MNSSSVELASAPVLEMLSVNSIFKPRLQRKYELELSDLQGKLTKTHSDVDIPELRSHKIYNGEFDVDCGEYFLFHGTSKGKSENIKTGGLDPRRGGESAGKLFGHASYLAANASKADLYTDSNLKSPETSRYTERNIIIFRAALGQCFRTKSAMPTLMHPPEDVTGKPMDSVLAETRDANGCVDHLEVMLYKESQVAEVTYRHVRGCSCALCKRRAVELR